MSDRIWGSPIGVRILSEQTVCIPKRDSNSKSSLGAAPNTPIQERILTMHEFLFFMIGFLLGGVIGISIMCLMQINRIHGGSTARKEDDEK